MTDDQPLQFVILKHLRRNPAGLVGLLIVLFAVVVAVLAPWISPHDPAKQQIAQRLTPPAWVQDGDPEHFLGTDSLGRDVLSRIIHGSRISLIIGLSAAFLSGAIGVFLGLVAGYFGGGLDTLISRISDVQQAIPFLVLAIAVVAMLGPGLFNLIVVLAVTTWVNYFRVVRGNVLSVREEQYVWAARSIGCSSSRIVLRHVLPNVAASIIVIVTLLVANMIIFEASLSFLGLGVPSSIPTWGRIVSDGREHVASAWWIALFPGLAILFAVMGINLLGDWLQERLDPKGRGR
ncbi:MAG: ABC transporter permease [Chloroflexi bacterium]|nr:ABC transporter permease [Chloroflexota bacterium]